VEKPELLRKLELMIDSAHDTKMWGEITILFKEGKPSIIRQEITTKIDEGNGTNHAKTYRR